jgi:hypothetical protein
MKRKVFSFWSITCRWENIVFKFAMKNWRAMKCCLDRRGFFLMGVITPPLPSQLKKKVSNYNTYECDFNMHKSAFYFHPHSVIFHAECDFTRRVILHAV